MKIGQSIGLSKPRGGGAGAARRAPGSRPVAGRPSQAGWIVLALIGLCVFLTTSPFTFTLTAQDPAILTTVDVSHMRQAQNSQVLLYLVRSLILVIAIAFALTRWRRAISGWRRLLPLAPFAAWCLLSIAWSDDPGISFRNVFALGVLVLSAHCLNARFSPREMALATMVGGGMIALFSLVYAGFLPVYGIHQHTDATQQVHAGSWRGVYLHKNFLGHLMATFCAATVWADRTVIRSTTLKWSLAALFLAITIFTRSASAIFIPPMTILLVWVIVAASNKSRLRASIILVPALLLAAIAMPLLLALVGRDESFTGRDKVWQIAMDSVLERPFHGFGYVSISYGDFGYRLMSATSLVDPHSGYFDIVLGTGVIGLLLFAVAILAAYRAARHLHAIGDGERQAALILASLMTGWLISCITESSDRPFTPEGGMGLFALGALLSMPAIRSPLLQAGRAAGAR